MPDELTWDYKSVVDNNDHLLIVTSDGAYNCRLCHGTTDKGLPIVEWVYEGVTTALTTDEQYENHGVVGFSRYIPSRKRRRSRI